MPRGRPRTKDLVPLKEANDRLQLLDLSGLSRRRRGELLAKSVATLEELLTNPEVDPFARIAAAKTIIRDVAGVTPSKTSAMVNGSQAPVVINIGEQPPSPGRARSRVAPDASDTQAPIIIDLPHNAP